MIKVLSAVVGTLAASVPMQKPQRIVKPPLAEQTPVIIRVMPEVSRADGNYVIEGGETERYSELKAKLDERYGYMFELKAKLERAQNAISGKWDEYYALRESYNGELQKLIAAWVTENDYK